MEKRFERNIPTLSEDEQKKLSKSRVAVIGLGGLGGYLCEMLARLGVGEIVICDGDVFDETNLNRQLLSSFGNIGTLKAEAALGWIESINSSIKVDSFCQNFSLDNASEILSGCDLVLDGLDNSCSRLILEDACSTLNIPIVHGAIAGLTAQVGVALPGSNMLHKLYGADAADSGEACDDASKISEDCADTSMHDSALKSALVCTPAFCASLQIAQVVSYLCKGEAPLTNKLLIASLDNVDFTTVPLS